MCVTCDGARAGGVGHETWVRRFSVDTTGRHPKGFTVYKITSILFPLGAPSAATAVSVWKRYSEVRALHAAIIALHSALHLAGPAVTLPSAAYFRRFDSKVIAERAAATERLLDFVADHRLLFTSAEFVTFLQTSQSAPQDAEAGDAVVPDTLADLLAGAALDVPTLAPVKVGLAAALERSRPCSTDPALVSPARRLRDDDRRDAPGAVDSGAVSAGSWTSGSSFEDAPLSDGLVDAESDYRRLFTHYRDRVELNLQAAKEEMDPYRRSHLKRQTSDLLAAAEALYRRHLAQEEPDPSAPPAAPHAALALPHLLMGAGELSLYRLLAVGAPGVSLLHRPSGAVRALTVVEKVPRADGDWERVWLTQRVPFVSRLLGYADTPERLFLVTDAAAGRLIDYVRGYGHREDIPWIDDETSPTTTELVTNSQRLLTRVEAALTDSPHIEREGEHAGERATELPAGAVRRWCAELLLAVEGFHQAGVVLRELHIDWLLIGPQGQLQLRYPAPHVSSHVTLTRVCTAALEGRGSEHVAPEGGEESEADWWSYGVVCYELICGEPLSLRHRAPFTAHSVLRTPRGTPLEAEALLTQLLSFSPSHRLGSDGVDGLKGHPYFSGLDWAELLAAWRNPPD